MLFGMPIDPILCFAVVGGAVLLLCGAHAWTEGRRFERLHGGRGMRRGVARGQGDHDDRRILIFRPSRRSIQGSR